MIAPNDAGSCDYLRPPWDARRLWNLWDMLDKYAWYFFVFSQLLGRLNIELGLPPPVFSPPSSFPSGGIGNPVLSGFNALGGGIGVPLQVSQPNISDSQKLSLVKILELIDDISKKIDVKLSNDIKRVIDYVNLPLATREKVIFYIENITNRSMDELRDQQFLHIKLARVPYYRSLEVLDGPLTKKFPRAIDDLYHAGSCYAVEQHTACVFHLMRVMEHCVQRFGKKLRAPIDVKNETWYQIMDHVHTAIKAMPSGKKSTQAETKKKERYALAAARLDHVRIVWRNPVMHPKESYDEKEAVEVLRGVNAFLESIVKLV
jgi:hypothetical protein